MNIIQKKLKNGLKIILVPQREAVTTTVLALIGVGSNNESRHQNGLSHFLEHMSFKQTKLHENAKSLNEAFESIGAITNAFTGEEYTGYYAKSHPRHTKKILELVADIVIDTKLPASEIEKEKGVVIEEINMYEDMPQYKVTEILGEILYGDTAAGRGIAGTKDSVLKLTHKDLLNFHKKFYVAQNTILTIVGNFDEKDILNDIDKTFGRQERGQKFEHVKIRPKLKNEKSKVLKKEIDQAHIALAFPAFERSHKDSATISMLGTILGGGMSSRLFQVLREELGVAYYVRSGVSKHSTYSEFVIRAGIDKKRIDEVLLAIRTILDDLKTNLVSDEELNKVKEFSIGMLGMSIETTDTIASLYATSLFETGKIVTQDDMVKKILKVKSQDILRVAKEILDYKKLKIALVGPGATEGDLIKNF